MNSTPRDFSSATFCCVAACAHIFPFIAGAMSTGASVASAISPIGFAASPCASSAMTFAVAGATSSSCARSARSMCPGFQPWEPAKTLVTTAFFESVCMVSGVMNSCAPCVITTCTSHPRFTSLLTRSAAL